MTKSAATLAASLCMLLVGGSQLAAQHSDILIQQNTAGTHVVLVDPLAPGNIIFGNTFDPVFFRTADPGYRTEVSLPPPGTGPLAPSTLIDFNLRAFTIDDGPASNLFYWDGATPIGVDSWTAPPDDHSVSLIATFDPTEQTRATVDGGAMDVAGFDFLQTDSLSGLHDHHIFGLEAPGTPEAGAYLFSMSMSADGLDESNPVYVVLGNGAPFLFTDPAADWLQDNSGLLQPVPEPATWVLACCGGVVLLTLLFRRMRGKSRRQGNPLESSP